MCYMTKLCLGTVQFGMNYGIQGNGQPDLDKAVEILTTAYNAGIVTYDTASAYGSAEHVLNTFLSQPCIDREKVRIISKTKSDGAVASFIISMIVAIVDIVIIILALAIMGLNTASILTVIATGGVAIGLALKDSLGNIASGIIIIINKPFKKGDYIIVSGVEGKVNKINLFNTLLTTWDNKVVVVPNSVAVNNPIINCDTASTRRVDIEIGFDYGVDIEKAREIISKIIELDERVSIEKPYQIVLSQFKESAAL